MQDVVYTQTSNYRLDLCGGSSGVNCSDYSYLIIENTGSSQGFQAHTGPIINSGVYPGFGVVSRAVYSILSSVSSLTVTGMTGMRDVVDFEFTYTLSNSVCPVCNSPSGTLNITQNGTYDVSSYASAEVDVPPVMGDYHDDLVRGVNAIYVLAGTILVIYFFYCIYRMIIKNVGDNK